MYLEPGVFGMGSQTLSFTVEKHLRGLCLKDFPCGNGSWSKSRQVVLEEQSWGYWEKDTGREEAAKEDQEALVELLTSPLSPWRYVGSWSPQAHELRELSIRSPERLNGNVIFNHFNTLRIVDKGVSIIDDGMLRFSCLKELVLSGNHISELEAKHLPCTLQVLELYGNQVSSLKDLTSGPLPSLQHLGLGCNRLGLTADIQYLTGTFWPRLVSLDLSWSGFQTQVVLVDGLATLPCLRALVLEGNPLTMTPSYPGFVLDSLPQLLYLDNTRVTPEDLQRFKGLARMRDMIVDQALATVTVRRIRGVPNPTLDVTEGAAECPVVSHRYSVCYEFPSQLPSAHEARNNTASTPGTMTGTAKEKYGENVGHQPVPKQILMMNHTPKLEWAETMDFSHTSTHVVGDLMSFKSFVLCGLWLTVEEEKTVSWTVSSEDQSKHKPRTGKRGGEKSVQPSSNTLNQRSKDNKDDEVQEIPIRRILNTVHVPLQGLMSGKRTVDVVCKLGMPQTEETSRAIPLQDKIISWKEKDYIKKVDKNAELGGDCTGGQKNAPKLSKSKGKGQKGNSAYFRMDEPSANIQVEPMTVEFTVHLEKWHSATEGDQAA
ncbi:hypothetical protein DPEC_G00264200 [Dallia pectoralis]|uniref:Uncharacterized protein n=1 Tax=Dallia pectoralis TaxID=75939 RepID=A0ACC2FSR2_DALPE|nr:hypothetical protein DPEC_G00264200 [Dallia pectoralis]